MSEQRSGYEVEDERPALRNPFRRRRIRLHQGFDYRSRAEIENNDCDHRRDKLRGVDGPEFSRRDSFPQHLTESLINRLEVTSRDPFHLSHAIGAGADPFALYHPRKTWIRRDVVEIGAHII